MWTFLCPPPILHDLQINVLTVGGKNYLVVGLRLFCFFVTPQYHVVVGEV